MSYLAVKNWHLISLFALILSTGIVWALALNAKSSTPKIIGFSVHGVSLLSVLISGFWLLTKIQVSQIDSWVYIKLGVWLFLAFSPFLIKITAKNTPIFYSLLLLVFLAFVLALQAVLFKF